MKICIITSNYYKEISKMLISGAKKKLKEKGIKNYKFVSVPGTFEIPVIVSIFINRYDAIIVLGCVIRGETSHFDYLCSSVFKALIDLSVKSKTPIGNGILTCENKKQALKRANERKKNKGGEAVEAAISTYKAINKWKKMRYSKILELL